MTEPTESEKLPFGAKLFIAVLAAVAVLGTVSLYTTLYMNFVSNENFKLANHCHNVKKHKPDYNYDRDCPQYKFNAAGGFAKTTEETVEIVE